MSHQLASYAIIREFRNNDISMKKIILEFIKKWLTMKCLNTVNSEFAILGLTDGICNEFGIKIPSAIIANVLRDLVRIKSLEFIYHKKVYKVKIELKIESDKLELFHKESEDIQSFLFRVKKYLEEQTKKEYSIKMVNKILIDYIDNSDNIEEIDETTLLALSKYIIDENKNNNNIFDKFKEGQLFISAITYENDFCNEDLLNSELIIYLDTEILFNALGYNGIPYLNEFNILKELVDFLNAKNTKKIKFKYLPIQKEEIDNIFVSLENNFYNDYSNKIAFLKIIAEAKKPENLPEVKVMFFKRLNGLGIEFYNHSIEVEKEYNLIYDESTKKEIESWAKKTNRHVDEKETLCLYQNVHSKIYKLRNGVNTLKLKELKAIFISGDALTNKISLLEKINLQQKIALSTYMEELITRLWFRSYNNIGNSLKITSTSTKAQIIIQNMLSKKIHSLINEAQMRVDNGELSNELMKEVSSDYIDTLFKISEVNISECVQENLLLETLDEKLEDLHKKRTETKEIKLENIQLKDTLNNKNSAIEQKDKELEEKEKKIKEYQEKEKMKKEKESRYFISVIFTIIFLSPFFFNILLLKNNWNSATPLNLISIGLFLCLIPLYYYIWTTPKEDWCIISKSSITSLGILLLLSPGIYYLFTTPETSQSLKSFMEKIGYGFFISLAFFIFSLISSHKNKNKISSI